MAMFDVIEADYVLWNPEWACRQANLFWYFFSIRHSLLGTKITHRVGVQKISVKIGPGQHFTWHRESAVNISHILFPIQTMHTYLNSALLTGFDSTKNIKILQKLIILEPFYEIRKILGHMSVIVNVFLYISRIWLVITLKYSKKW